MRGLAALVAAGVVSVACVVAAIAVAAGTAADPVAGAKVFASAGCGGCHTLAAAGSKGKVGPNLDQLKPDAARVVRQVTNGGGVMPSFRGRLTAQQIENVGAFVERASRGWRPPAAKPTRAVRITLRGRRLLLSVRRVASGPVTLTFRVVGPRARVFVVRTGSRVVARVPVPGERSARVLLPLRPGGYAVLSAGGRAAFTVVAPAERAAQPQDGKSIFRSTCGGCHTLADAGTTGKVGPNLDEEEPDYDDVVEQVLEGGGGMPSFRNSLTREQIDLVARYVSSVAKGD